MDWQPIINIAIAAAFSTMGWFMRTLWYAIQKLKDDLHQCEVDLPMHYVRKDEFTTAMKELKDELRTGFNRLYDKLDGKQDKEF